MKHTQPKVQLPVSRKFYSGLNDRVIGTLATVGCDLLPSQVMAHINAYIMNGVIPSAADHGVEMLLIFHLLRPEIDKAIDRSLRARAAAARRRAAKENSIPEPVKAARSETVAAAAETVSESGIAESNETLNSLAEPNEAETMVKEADIIVDSSHSKTCKSKRRRNKRRKNQHR